MHLLVIGGTGRNGSLAVQEALARGHSVTALVRDPKSARLSSHVNLRLVRGRPTSEQDIMTALKTPQPPQVVITALAQVRTSESPFAPLHPDTSPDFLSSSMRALLAAIEKANPSSQIKIIINSAQGVGASWGSMNFLGRMIFSHGSMAIGLKDHNEVDRLIRSSGVAFVSPRPCLLTEGDSKVVKVWPEDGRGCAWMPKISRASVGKWLLDAAESDEWNGNAPVISN